MKKDKPQTTDDDESNSKIYQPEKHVDIFTLRLIRNNFAHSQHRSY